MLQDADGMCALHKAVQGQHAGVASLLVQRSPAARSVCTKHGLTPHALAQSMSKPVSASLLSMLESNALS